MLPPPVAEHSVEPTDFPLLEADQTGVCAEQHMCITGNGHDAGERENHLEQLCRGNGSFRAAIRSWVVAVSFWYDEARCFAACIRRQVACLLSFASRRATFAVVLVAAFVGFVGAE